MQMPINDLNAWSNRQIYANEQNHKLSELNEEVGKFLGYDNYHIQCILNSTFYIRFFIYFMLNFSNNLLVVLNLYKILTNKTHQ